MKKKTSNIERQTREVIAEIKEKLHVIEGYMHWLIRADQRFTRGQRVEWSRHGRSAGFPTRKCAQKGTVLKIENAFSILVKLDGIKHPRSFHHAFFNPVSGPKLF